jgi:AcrR family transcriptional regulator
MSNKSTVQPKPQTSDRAASEAALEAAALQLLKKDGVLAGLNLREVADAAGVNRGLVYHYFGSRQELLRSALRRGVKQRLAEILASGGLPFNARIRQLVRTMLGQEEAVNLATLLLLDGREKLPVAPLKDQWLEGFERDVAEQKIAGDTDQQALLALMTALSYGYVVFRQAIAEELNIPVADMDYRVDDVFGKMLSVFENKKPEQSGQ